MRRLIVFSAAVLAAFICVTEAVARQLTPEEALAGARTAGGSLRHKMPSLSAGAMKLAYTGARDGVNCYYVFNGRETDGGGFLIVSADDLAPAVLGHVDSGEFDYDRAPAAMRWWLSQFEANITDAVRTGTPIRREVSEERPLISQLLSTKWGQGDPYNKECPMVSGRRSVTGCVATAMAQIMRYHRWPEVGTGSHSYRMSNGATVSADFSSTEYDWDNMTDTYTMFSSNTRKNAVARLMYHCGVSVNMNYSPDASGASSFDVAGAFIKYFGYDPGIRYEERAFYTDSEWEDMVYRELAEGRPVLYSGVTVKNEGHAFVCDGYSGDGLYHFNWGWEGVYDGDFLITGAGALNPEGTGTGGGTVGYGFTEGQGCLFGVEKAGCNSQPAIVLAAPAGYTFTNNGRSVTRSTQMSINGGIYSYSALTADVELGMMFRNTATGDECYTGIGLVSLEPAYGVSSLSFTAECVTVNGEYEVIPVYRAATAYDNWQEVRIPADMTIPRVKVTGDRPALMLAGDTRVGSNGDNTTTADNVEIHFTLSAASAVSGTQILGAVFNSYGSLLDYAMTSVSMNAGETREFVMSADMSANLSVGGEYVLMLQDYSSNSWLTPNYYCMTSFTVVEPSGISETVASAAGESARKVDVYSMAGTLLRRGVPASEALSTLPAGMYIVGGKKIVKR